MPARAASADRRHDGPAPPRPRRSRIAACGRRAWQQRTKARPGDPTRYAARRPAVGSGRSPAVASPPVSTTPSPADGPADPRPVVEVRDLVVRYGDHLAVDHLSFGASAGTVLALLGPNGAGKTSTVETLEGYRRPASGQCQRARPRPGRRPRRADPAGRRHAAGRRRLHRHATGRGPAPVRLVLRRPDRPRRAARDRSGWPTGPARSGRTSREASSNGSRSPWPWSAVPRSPSSTSPRPASTRAVGS